MRTGTSIPLWGAALAVLAAAGCFDFPVERWTAERRIAVRRPAVVQTEPGKDGKPKREVVYVPQGETNIYYGTYYPNGFYPYGYYPGFVVYPQDPYGSYPRYYGGSYPGYYGGTYPGTSPGLYPPTLQATSPFGVGTQTIPSPGYAGGALYPSSGTAQPSFGGGTRYYPGSGKTYGAGQPRESFGIYGDGNTRR